MKKRPPRSQAAFSLVEVALALGVAAFCMVSIFGLVPIGVNTNLASFEQTGAANIASAVATDLRATLPGGSATSQTTPFYQIPLPATTAGSANSSATFFVHADGTISGTMNQDAVPAQLPHYRVTLSFVPTGSGGTSTVSNPNATSVRILVTWPAMADPAVKNQPTAFAGSFESFAGMVATN